MNNNDTEKILSDLERGYDLIADKFSGTRSFMWRDLGFVRGMVRRGDKVLDFGCGNGRLAGFLKNNYQEYVGVDISQRLIDIAKQKYSSEKTKFIKADANFNKLPFKDDYFDVIFSIAVFHHFPSKEYALRITKELYRVLKPGGKIIVTVWNLWQKQYLKYHQKTSKSWIDANIPFKSGEKVFKRYHHPFQIRELEELFREIGFKTLESKEGWNLLYIGEKSAVDKQTLTTLFI
ncbi:MAG: methyltransferase domain-containing protein [Patescibacteria group bacterium]|nr:methyltransferase domain-containing protein [Patescibacteria group bacterium]